MTTSMRFGFLFAAGLACLRPAAAAPAPFDFGSTICEMTAQVVGEAAVREARANFFLAVAGCLNDSGSSFPACFADALDEVGQAIAHAQDQYQARLDACALLGPGAYDPDLDPSDFSPKVDNAFLPLVPGRTLVYEKRTDEGLERVEVTTLDETVEIDGFECRAVNDVEYLDDEVVEDTVDWFAQERDGAVWYFGEISQSFEDGLLDSLGGSWKSGKDGAKPGILMLEAPARGDTYRQEYFLGEAEDIAQVVSLGETVVVPFGTFTGCLQTQEWSPLEPGNFERKFYAPGIGLVLELDPDTGERLELVDIIE